MMDFERQYEKLKETEARHGHAGGRTALLINCKPQLMTFSMDTRPIPAVMWKRCSQRLSPSGSDSPFVISNIAAVILETIPHIDQSVGNAPGNFFDVFEAFSVSIFMLEYLLRLFSVVKDREHLYSIWFYATTFFGIVDLLACAPFFVEQILLSSSLITRSSDSVTVFRLFRIFRILQLEHFVVAFTVLDNVFRASRDVLNATGLMALIIWIGCGALFFIFEQDNPNWRSCNDEIPLHNENRTGCFDFSSTADCNAYWGDGACDQSAFVSMPDSLYYTAVFLGGEWGKIDFTAGGRCVCVFLCVVGIAIYAIPIGTLFDSFGAIGNGRY